MAEQEQQRDALEALWAVYALLGFETEQPNLDEFIKADCDNDPKVFMAMVVDATKAAIAEDDALIEQAESARDAERERAARVADDLVGLSRGKGDENAAARRAGRRIARAIRGERPL